MREKVDGAMLKVAAAADERFLAPIEGSHLDYYMNALKDCINCGACKIVCPVCACGEGAKCTDFHSAADGYKISLFHLVRFVHLMDSCIGCGQCTDVCPAEISLTHIYQRFARPMQEEFEYVPGMDMRTPPFFGVDLIEEEH
ncbi:MAG TPA: 4Fe-4S dicluster domain-containing protein [Methanosarcinales archaeon]|nr:4Fe-4S dicluster domain-containing protein [Methanosarcinales archaeon]